MTAAHGALRAVGMCPARGSAADTPAAPVKRSGARASNNNDVVPPAITSRTSSVVAKRFVGHSTGVNDECLLARTGPDSSDLPDASDHASIPPSSSDASRPIIRSMTTKRDAVMPPVSS